MARKAPVKRSTRPRKAIKGLLPPKKRAAKFLKEFFAVTETSVYRAVIAGRGSPKLIKLSCRGDSRIIVGTVMKAPMLAVCWCLQLFFPEGKSGVHVVGKGEREVAKFNDAEHLGGGTSPIIALFLNEADAMLCDKANSLRYNDLRWREQTIAVLRAIGEKHPRCSISHNPQFQLMLSNEWQPAKT